MNDIVSVDHVDLFPSVAKHRVKQSYEVNRQQTEYCEMERDTYTSIEDPSFFLSF